jgi:predicted nucleic acid-binding protein
VVDASALAAAVFEEPEAEIVRRRMAGSDVVAPNRYFLKMAILPRPVDYRTTPILAEELGLTGYDACYVRLARNLDAELATLDQRLARAARKASRR